MDDVDDFQRRMLGAARAQGKPGRGATDRLQRRLDRARRDDALANPEPTPQATEAEVDAFADRMLQAARRGGIPPANVEALGDRIVASTRPQPMRARAWAVGAAAAAAALLLIGFGLRAAQRQATSAPGSAVYGSLEPDGEVAHVRTRRSEFSRESSGDPTPQSNRVAEENEPALAVPVRLPSLKRVVVPRQTTRPTSRTDVEAPAVEPAPEPPAPPDRDVAGEAVALSDVQRALSQGRVAAAQAALAGYRQKFPDGVLAPEAEGLAAIIGCRTDKPGARATAEEFVRAHTGSPLEARVADACKKNQSGQTEAAP